MAIVRANFAWYDAMIQALTAFSGFMSSTSANNRVEIYSGTIPEDADSWTPGGTGSPTNLLATFADLDLNQNVQTNYIVSVNEAVFDTAKAPNPGTVNATANGTASWYALFDTAAWSSSRGLLLGEISLSGGNGTLHLDDLTLVAGQPTQLLHWGLLFTNP
jgi:hypothetical protein